MSKHRKVSFNFSGKLEDVQFFIRQFSTHNVLKKINQESIKLLDSINDGIPAAKWINYKIYNSKTLQPHNKKLLMAVWDLIELAYYSIKFSNDYRGKKLDNDEEFYALVDAVEGYRQTEEENFLNNLDNDKVDFFCYLWGFAGEQRKLEMLGKIFESAGRELYILFESSKHIIEKVDISEIVREETGLSWEKIPCSLLLGWLYFYHENVYQRGKIRFNESVLSEKEFLNVLMRYSAKYEEIKSSPLKRQIFYTKPYVITQSNELSSISPFLNLSIYEHCILWIVRDRYFRKGDQGFTSYFGKCFEKYFEELLTESLNETDFYKIPEKDSERADWRIEVCGYKFLIEQKSTIIRLAAKQQQSDINAIKDFANKTIFKAIRQLYETEKVFGDGKYIKIILLYDDYLKTEILETFFKMDEFIIDSDDYFWLVTIEEVEMLFSLYIEDQELFKEVIEEKIKRETTHSIDGRSLFQILTEKGINENQYLNKDEISYYTNLAKEIACAAIGRGN